MGTHLREFDRVSMVFKNLCMFVLWTKVAAALKGLTSYHTFLSWSFVSVRLEYFCNNWLRVDIEWRMPCAPVLNEIESYRLIDSCSLIASSSSSSLYSLTIPMLGLLSAKAQRCKTFWKSSKPCHVGKYI